MSLSVKDIFARYWSIEYCADRKLDWWLPWAGLKRNRFTVKASALRVLRHARREAKAKGRPVNGMYRVVEYTRTKVVNR